MSFEIPIRLFMASDADHQFWLSLTYANGGRNRHGHYYYSFFHKNVYLNHHLNNEKKKKDLLHGPKPI